MDVVTHITAGGLSAQTLRQPRQDRFLLLFCILAAVLPDIDNFVGLMGTEMYLIHHRGIAHSFFGGVFLSLFLAGVFTLCMKSFPFRKGVVIAYIMILGHIFLDLITSYGTQIFNPFSHTRYSVECIFIIDPLFTGVAAFLLYRSFRSLRRRKQFALIGVAWLLLYPMLSLSIRFGLQYQVEQELARQGAEFQHVYLSTDIFAPLFWKVIIEHDATYDLGGISLLHPRKPLTLTTYTKADPRKFAELGAQVSMFRTYAWFAKYPIMQIENRSDGTHLIFSDVRFFSTLPFMQNMMQPGKSPFSLVAILDRQQKLVGYIYNNRMTSQLVNTANN